MATITRFEDLAIWQLARIQCNDIDELIETTSLKKDYELRGQISRSTGSVMDNIAEGFERLGNMEFKNFLLIAKGSNGEVRSQLYRASDRKHITRETFDQLYEKNLLLGNKLMSFVGYLQKSGFKGQRYKDDASSNIKHQTPND
jgi:four helix bundle protein